MHLFYYTPEIPNFLNKCNFEGEKQYLILFNLQKILQKYSKLCSDKINEIPENERIINVYELRKSLEELYKGEGLFKIGQSGDPADLIFLFLNAFHSYFMLAHSLKFSIEKECNPLCISHQYFRFNLIQQNQCMNCNATSDILKYALNFFIYEISLKKIIYKIEELESLDYFQNKLFILFKEITSKTRLDCPNKCKNPNVKKNIVVIEPTPYYFFHLSWKETTPKLVDICKVLFMIPLSTKNSDIFKVYSKELQCNYNLYGMILYWGGHFTAIFQSGKDEGQNNWILHDDKNIIKFKMWKDVIVHCIKSHSHPIILFYKQSETRGSLFDMNISLRDYNNLIKHCEIVDLETQEDLYNNKINNLNKKQSESSIKRVQSKIRPSLHFQKSNDKLLLKQIQNLQKLEELKKKNEELNEDELEEIKEIEKEEEFLPEIDYKLGQWTCKNCKNINNFENYICIKCKYINIKVYEEYEKKKEISIKLNDQKSSERYDILTKNFEKTLKTGRRRSSIIKRLSTSGIITPKYKLGLISVNSSASDVDEEEIKKKRFHMNDDNTWNCPFCGFVNESESENFCEECKKNKPEEGYEIVTEEELDKINGVKQYLSNQLTFNNSTINNSYMNTLDK